jgi:ZIP family zinc transporter
MRSKVEVMNPLAILLPVATFFSTLAGGWFTLRNQSKLNYFFAFSAGTLIAISFLDLLPESAALAAQNGIALSTIFFTVLAGFVVFHMLEKLILIHSHAQEEPGKHEHAVGTLGGSALIFHSFLDGVAIGIAFHADVKLGLLISFAVILHDFADGLNTVTLLLKSQSGTRKATVFLLLDALAPVAGALIALFVSIPEAALAFLLAWFVGEFIYLGATDMLPSAHSMKTSRSLVLATLAGVALIYALTRVLNF